MIFIVFPKKGKTEYLLMKKVQISNGVTLFLAVFRKTFLELL